jgi:hypothetical protein
MSLHCLYQKDLDSSQSFLQTKRPSSAHAGMGGSLTDLLPQLFPFQQAVVQWALRKGRAFIEVELKEFSIRAAPKNLERALGEKGRVARWKEGG